MMTMIIILRQSGEYVLGHLDLHWQTSEHAIDQTRSDLEVQLNFFDLSFDTYEAASETPGATVSLGLLFNLNVSIDLINNVIHF